MYLIILLNALFLLYLIKTINGDIKHFLRKHLFIKLPIFSNLLKNNAENAKRAKYRWKKISYGLKNIEFD